MICLFIVIDLHYYIFILQDRMGHRVEDQRLSIFLHDNDTLLQSNIYHNIDVQLHTYGKNMANHFILYYLFKC